MTVANVSATIGERPSRRKFKLKQHGREIMASRGGRKMSRGGKKKKDKKKKK